MATTADAERLAWLSDRTMRLLCAAMDRDPDESVRLLAEIADTHGTSGMYGVCCALAQSVLTLVFPEFKRGDGTLTGAEMIGIAHLPGASNDDPHTLWACRLVAAYANGDMDTTDSLFFGSLADEDAHTGGVIALLGMSADVARRKEAEAK